MILTLEKLDYAAGSGELLSDSGDTAMLVFSFAPVKIEDRGVYVCSAAVNSMEPLSAELNLTVQCKKKLGVHRIENPALDI